MKTVSPELEAHLNAEEKTLALCVKLTLMKYPPRIVNITNANPGVVETRWAHDFTTGDACRLMQVRGMTQVNRQEVVVTTIDATHFSIGVNTSGYGAYTGKGVAQPILGFTTHPKNLVFQNVTYKAHVGYSSDAIRQGSDLAVDSIDHRGILQNAAKYDLNQLLIDGVSDEDLLAGFYDNARVSIFAVNYEDLTQGMIAMPVAGNLGKITLQRGIYNAEFVSESAKLQQELQEVYSQVCRADLGDDFDGSEPEHDRHPGYGCKVRLDPPKWKATTAYTVRPAGDAGLGSVVKATNANIQRRFECSTAGTSAASEPTWNITLGATTTDGTAVWTTREGLTKVGIVHSVIDRRRFRDDDRYEPPTLGQGGTSTLFPIAAVNQGAKQFTIAGNFAAEFPAQSAFSVTSSPGNDGDYTIAAVLDSGANTVITVNQSIPSATADGNIVGRIAALVGFFTHGKVTFLDGKNKGIAREVRAFSLTTVDGETFTGPGLFELFEAFPFDIAVGDRYEAHAGCDKSLVMCLGKFDNMHNRRAEDNIPGTDRVLLYPDAK